MTSYEEFLRICQKNSNLSKSVIDDFLIYYAAKQDRVDQEFENRLRRFRHLKPEFPPGFVSLIKSQYIAHRIFRKGGLISRYLNHRAIKDLEKEARDFLADAANNPWRFSFSVIMSNPAKDFYEMEDIFSGDQFLLYSPSISQTVADQSVSVWFNLIAFNGACWQSLGPVIFYKSFDEDDIFFFATEVNECIETPDDLLNDLENNPLPYMMLVLGSNYPPMRHGDFEVVNVKSEVNVVFPNQQELEKDFLVEYTTGVFRLKHKIWSEPPHFTEAFYDEGQELACLSGLTEEGYAQMMKLLNKYNFNFPPDPEIRLHMAAIPTFNQILNRNLNLNPYSERFEINHTPEEDDFLKKMNQVLSLSLPYINAGKEPDLALIAKEVGLDEQTVRDLIGKSVERINKLRKSR